VALAGALLFFALPASPTVSAREIPEAVVETADTTAIAEIAPVTSLIASDHKYDDGDKIDLAWVPSIDDLPRDGLVTAYKIYRITNDGAPVEIAELTPGANSFRDEDRELDSTYSYYVAAMSDGSTVESNRTAPIQTEREWLNLDRKFMFLVALILGGAIVYFIETARRGKKLFVRRIAGLEAVDEAIGRATEMGRPILFIPGIHDMDDVQTLAAITILGRVAGQVAEYETKIRMPVARSLVMTAARETIKAAYQTAATLPTSSSAMWPRSTVSWCARNRRQSFCWERSLPNR